MFIMCIHQNCILFYFISTQKLNFYKHFYNHPTIKIQQNRKITVAQSFKQFQKFIDNSSSQTYPQGQANTPPFRTGILST